MPLTQWAYRSHNCLLEMIYPDKEKVTYTYDLGGQLTNVHGYKPYGYDYVGRIGYDKFGQRTYMKYCNGAETFYTYELQGLNDAGGRTSTAKFSLYVSPYLVANQGGRYTKHIYIGGERIVSKIGDFASYGPDPRRIEYAGSEADAVTVDYDVKYSQQLQAIKDNYATFGVPYDI